MVAATRVASTKRRAAKVKNRRTCADPVGCKKNPYFGWHGEKAAFCVSHKKAGALAVHLPVMRMAGWLAFCMAVFFVPPILCLYADKSREPREKHTALSNNIVCA